MTMNLKSSTVIFGVALFTAIFLATELDARGRGGRGGGGGFSRGGVASGGGFSARSGQRARPQVQRQGIRTGSQGNRQEMAEIGKLIARAIRKMPGAVRRTDRNGQMIAVKIVRMRQRIDRKTGRTSLMMNSITIMITGTIIITGTMMTVNFWQVPL